MSDGGDDIDNRDTDNSAGVSDFSNIWFLVWRLYCVEHLVLAHQISHSDNNDD